jgi:hypothetical protein
MKGMYPSADLRPSFLVALAIPFFRSHSIAPLTSPPLSSNARLQSIIGEPVCVCVPASVPI